MEHVYLDYNATAPIDTRVAQAMTPYLHTYFGNPSSGHAFGVAAKAAVEKARKQVAWTIGCGVDEVIFTSGGSESNNYAIKGVAYAYRAKGDHIITSSIEHPSVTEVCHFLEGEGFKTTFLPVDGNGLVDPAAVEAAITPHTILISIMHANNEVGTIQPISEIAAIARERRVLIHTDCAQSMGKIQVRVDELGVDMLSIAGHKLYAPKGVGALYVRNGVFLEKLVHGADHEMNRRAGTENVLEIVGLGEACVVASENLEAHHDHLKATRDRLEDGLKAAIPGIRIIGHPERRLPNTLSVSFPGLQANTIVAELSETVAVSAGAACHADRVDVSSVLQAMDIPLEEAMGTIRFSTGRGTTAREIDYAVERVAEVVERLQPSAGAIPLAEDAKEYKLTRYTHGLGCACKLRPQLLEAVLKQMPVTSDPRIVVGTDTADDAAVYKLDDDTAIVQTVDFFTPILDDPFQFGAVAAANALSDIYAMGARPLFALNIVGFPSGRLPMSVLEDILDGARSKTDEAGVPIIGGHTIDDTEPKYGMAVTGMVDFSRVLTNSGARPGDSLVLTKPVGTGVMSTAMKQGMLEPAQQQLLYETMAELNRSAAEAMVQIGVNSCTDVTGFGLLGHLLEMMTASGMKAQLRLESVPILEGAVELATSGMVPGGTKDNAEFTSDRVRYAGEVSQVFRWLLNDAQTSGGLLIAVPDSRALALLTAMEKKRGRKAYRIGEVVAAGAPAVVVV